MYILSNFYINLRIELGADIKDNVSGCSFLNTVYSAFSVSVWI